MSDTSRHRTPAQHSRTANTFVEILDTIVNDFDVIDVLTRLTSICVDLLNIKAAGILLSTTTASPSAA